MKNLNIIEAVFGAAIAVFVFTACGSSSSNNGSALAAGTCSAGYVYSASYGCLVQSNCPSGSGLYNNQCVAITSTTTTAAVTCSTSYVYSSTYGCVLQSNCPTGYGMYNNQCVLLNPSTSTTSTLTCPSGYSLSGGSCVAVNTTPNSCQGSCPAGYSQTPYGCLPQYRCPSCFGYSNGYCVTMTGYSYFLGY